MNRFGLQIPELGEASRDCLGGSEGAEHLAIPHVWFRDHSRRALNTAFLLLGDESSVNIKKHVEENSLRTNLQAFRRQTRRSNEAIESSDNHVVSF